MYYWDVSVMQDQSDDNIIDYTVDYLSAETTAFTQVSADSRVRSRAQGISISSFQVVGSLIVNCCT